MGSVRSEVMWQAVRDALDVAGGTDKSLVVLDLGGGTGGDAVRLARLGHRVTVVDPSPDALASLHRRAIDEGIEGKVRGVQGDTADLGEHIDEASVDLVLCHGVLEYVDDPGQALAAIARTLRSGGHTSVVTINRYAGVFARVLSGNFTAAASILDATWDTWDVKTDGPRRFVISEVVDLLGAYGLVTVRTNALRVFADLVSSGGTEHETGAQATLYALEQRVRSLPEFAALSAGLQAISCLEWKTEDIDRGGNGAAL